MEYERNMLLAVEVHAERAELPREVPEGLGQVLGDVEHEGTGVVGLTDDPGDAERVVPVVPQDRVLVAHAVTG